MNIRVVVDGELLLEKDVPSDSLTALGTWAAITAEVSSGILCKAVEAFRSGDTETVSKTDSESETK